MRILTLLLLLSWSTTAEELTMIDKHQLEADVIIPVLLYLAPDIPYSKAAVELLLGTATVESNRGDYIRQLGGGPALGIYQMEPATYSDIYDNYLRYNKHLMEKIEALRSPSSLGGEKSQLIGNLFYATALARVHYKRVPKSLPLEGDLEGMANYWKDYYNTHLGAGTIAHYMEKNDGRIHRD